MRDLTPTAFGLAAAYLIPGFLALAAFGEFSPLVRAWLGVPPADAPSLGGFLYVGMASIAAGLLLGAVRWLTLDRVHQALGVRPPAWDFSALQRNLAAFEGSVDNHLRYYQFYGHSLLALILAAAVRGPRLIHSPADAALAAAVLLPLGAVLFLASRDALSKHYLRTAAILGTLPSSKGARTDDQRLAPDARTRGASSRGRS